MDVYENLKKRGIVIPEGLPVAGLYKPVKQAGNLLFVSGQGSIEGGKPITGRVGINLTVDEAQIAARVWSM